MGDLVIQETIHVSTTNGVKEIQVMLGDITKLPLESKVDIIMVSAFPGDYHPVRGTLIGALSENFRLSVACLARKKAEDWRKHLNCWISEPLPDAVPYKTPKSVHEAKSQVVGGLFRALFALIDKNNDDFSVITPLLGTGNQALNKTMMMKSMLRSCIYWMRAGLPLRRILFVIYRKSSKFQLPKSDAEALEEFRRIKTITENENAIAKVPLLARDALIVYATSDESVVNEFVKNMKSCQQGEKVIVNKQSVEKLGQSDYEEAMQNSMLQSKHVLVALSPNLMRISEGIEMYNMALCLSRRSGRQLLIPLYVSSIDQLPTYMTLIQWIDLRLKARDLQGINKILQAAEMYLKVLFDNSLQASLPSVPSGSSSRKVLEKPEEWKFDLFLSYSHRDTEPAKVILSTLKAKNANLRIFFDKEGIKTGHSWQATVFESVSRSRIVVALLSPSYFASCVCCEEFNLALSLHVTRPASTCLIPLCLYSWQQGKAPIEKVPLSAHVLPLLSFQKAAPNDDYFNTLADFLSNSIGEGNLDELLRKHPFASLKISKVWELQAVLSHCRKDFFHEHWQISESGSLTCIQKNQIQNNLPESGSTARQMAIVFHDDDSLPAEFMKKSLQDIWHDAVQVSMINCPGFENAIGALDQMETVVVLLSGVFVNSAVTMDVMQVCLSLRRSRRPDKFHLCPVIVSDLPADPLFIHLIPCRFSAVDKHIEQLCQDLVSSGQLPKAFRSLITSGKLSATVAVTVSLASQWLTQHTHFGRLNVESTEGTFPVVSSIADFEQNSFPHSVKFVTLNEADFLRFGAEEESKTANEPDALDLSKGTSSEPKQVTNSEFEVAAPINQSAGSKNNVGVVTP